MEKSLNRRENIHFYYDLAIDLLGAFYYYIENKIQECVNVELMENEIRLIHEVAKERNISILKLHLEDLSFIKREIALLKDEDSF